MINLLRADWYRIKRWGFFYVSLLCMTGVDLLNEIIKRIIQKKNRSFFDLMISGTEQKFIFLLTGMLLLFYLYQERESGFIRQIAPLYPKWKQVMEKLLFGILLSFLIELFFFAEHLAKVFYFRLPWTAIEMMEAEAFWIGNLFFCMAFVTVGICLAEWIKGIWMATAVLSIFIWGWPLYFAFEKMMSVVGGAEFLSYGMFQTFSRFCSQICEKTFLQTIFISIIWMIGFGCFAFLGRLRQKNG